MSIRETFARPFDLPEPISLSSRLLDVIDTVIKPPERINPLEAAIKYYKLSNDYAIGPYDPEVTPYTKEVLEVMAPDSGFGTIIFVGPAQVGKTNMFLAWLMYNLVVDPADVMLIEKSMTEARDYSVARFDGFAADNAEIVNPLYKTGKTSKSIYQKFFSNGMILRFGWPSRNQLSGKAIPRLWASDYDRYTDDIGGEGEAFPLINKRRTTFGDRSKVIVESSPSRLPDKIEKYEPETPFQAPKYPGILGLYNTGDMRRWLWQCLGDDCQKWFEGNIDTVKWPGKGSHTPDTKDKVPNSIIAKQCWVECPHCERKYESSPGKHLTEHYRDVFNANGRWFASGVIVDGLPTGEVFNPSDTASFWMKGPAARFTQWHGLVKKYLDAKDQYDSNGTEGTLKGVMNTDWGEAWIPPSSSSDLTIEFLRERAEGPAKGVVPHWVRYIILTIDVQAYSFELQAHGFGEQGQVCFIDRWNITQSRRVRPTTDGMQIYERLRPGVFPEDFEILVDEALNREFELEGEEGTMKAVLVSCDTGGYGDASGSVANNVYNFWRSLPTRGSGLQSRFLPLKGEPKPNAAPTDISYPDSSGRKERRATSRGDVPLLMVGTTEMKDLSSSRLYRQEVGPGFIHIPAWAEESWYRELTAESKFGNVWKKTQKRNESWDLYVYAHAVNICKFLKGDQINWSNPPDWAMPWGYNPFVRLTGHEISAPVVEKELSKGQVLNRFAAMAQRFNDGD